MTSEPTAQNQILWQTSRPAIKEEERRTEPGVTRESTSKGATKAKRAHVELEKKMFEILNVDGLMCEHCKHHNLGKKQLVSLFNIKRKRKLILE